MTVSTIQHASYTGPTRYGKTECCIARVAPKLLHRDRASLWAFDPPGTMTTKIGAYLRSHEIPFLYDKLAETAKAPGYPICSLSTNPDPEQREAEIREIISDIIALLVRAEGKLDATKNHMILRGLTDAAGLYLNQSSPVPFYLLKDCFVGESDVAQFLLRNLDYSATHSAELAMRMMFYHRLRGQQRDFHVGAAERRLIEACSCVQFRKRCVPTFDVVRFINEGGIALIDGSSSGNLSRQDCGFLMGMLILMLISLARSGKLTRKLIIVIDEGMVAGTGLIDLHVSRALCEAGKWGGGVEFHLIFQNPLSFPIPEIGDQIFQNCSRAYFFRQINPDAAFKIARMCCMSTYDPHKVKNVMVRLRQEHAGVDIQPIKHTSESADDEGDNKRITTSESHVTVPIFRQYEERQEIHFSEHEQTMLWAQRLRNFRVGECVIQDGETIFVPEGRLPLLQLRPRTSLLVSREPRMTLGEFEFNEYVKQLKTTSMYATPNPFEIPCETIERQSWME